jgi:PKD repeat protein
VDFSGGDPASSTDQNPANICYNVPGIYDVTLITTNGGGSDTLTLSNYITVYTNPFATCPHPGWQHAYEHTCDHVSMAVEFG